MQKLQPGRSYSPTQACRFFYMVMIRELLVQCECSSNAVGCNSFRHEAATTCVCFPDSCS